MKKQSIQVGIALLKKILFMLALIGDISFCVLYIVCGVHHYVSPEEFMKVHAGFIGLAVIAALCMLFEVPRMMFSVKVSGTTFSSQGNTTWSNSPFNERNPRYRGFLLLSDYIVSFASSGYFFVISTNLSKFSIKASTTNGANCRPFWETISS